MHLILANDREQPQRNDYAGLPKAVIDTERCTACGLCLASCRFGAVQLVEGRYQVAPYTCEGCGVRQALCPEQTVRMVQTVSGETMLYQNRQRVFSTARLLMGSGASGKLVTQVKGQLRKAAGEDQRWPSLTARRALAAQ